MLRRRASAAICHVLSYYDIRDVDTLRATPICLRHAIDSAERVCAKQRACYFVYLLVIVFRRRRRLVAAHYAVSPVSHSVAAATLSSSCHERRHAAFTLFAYDMPHIRY